MQHQQLTTLMSLAQVVSDHKIVYSWQNHIGRFLTFITIFCLTCLPWGGIKDEFKTKDKALMEAAALTFRMAPVVCMLVLGDLFLPVAYTASLLLSGSDETDLWLQHALPQQLSMLLLPAVHKLWPIIFTKHTKSFNFTTITQLVALCFIGIVIIMLLDNNHITYDKGTRVISVASKGIMIPCVALVCRCACLLAAPQSLTDRKSVV